MTPPPINIPVKPPSQRWWLLGKIFFVGFLILILFLPMGMIQSLITERNERQDSADWEVIRTWGREQTLGGPVLTVPYLAPLKDEKGKVHNVTQFAHFLPDQLKFEGQVIPEVRYRGIFKIPLYQVSLQVQGRFLRPDFSQWRIAEKDIFWEDSFLSVGIPDMRAIRESVALSWGDRKASFEPGSAARDVFPSGMAAKIQDLRGGKPGEVYAFSFPLKIAGSKDLNFLPFGKTTETVLHSNWKDPSFIGAYLPVERTVDEKGFTAQWKVLDLGRNYPQQWLGNELKPDDWAESAYGVSLFLPVETYQKTTRTAKYAVLFIALTFITFFFFEIMGKLRIHPIQYLLVGFALCLFYLLLLSLAEHIRFVLAYVSATAATVLLIVFYSSKVLKNAGRAVVMGGILSGLYGYLYVLLQLQDLALLLGSVGLFVILGLIMFITRRVDWYAVNSGREVVHATV